MLYSLIVSPSVAISRVFKEQNAQVINTNATREGYFLPPQIMLVAIHRQVSGDMFPDAIEAATPPH